ncbi:hypothetical protein OL239_12370 [Arthrobacter sp. ATA002]|uniref:hypothetical protein n=1 Tax=Arthrobacter sp. ATA002 TaxID=2991715 RepID=UPI0022A6E956|nr:hypothetical protein [Arthrobacter sp. ATA002]WAP50794.1 hypothetical protein OL239_12370 [Arthrobacter sp. ATA002]
MVSTTLGAVAGPNLVTPMGGLAGALGIPALAGPFLLAGAAYLAAGVVLLVFLRPDPFLLARRLRKMPPPTTATAPRPRALRCRLRKPAHRGPECMSGRR